MPTKFDVLTVTLNPAMDRTLTISNFKAGAVNRVEQERVQPGGKGVNVAHALADFGCRVAVTGFLGRENSATFETLFDARKIEGHFVRIAGQPRVGIKITDPVLKQTTDINFPGLTVTAADLEALHVKIQVLESQWVVLAGSLPPGMEASIYRDFIAMLKARGQKIALDSSGEALRQGILARPDVIKPNLVELEELLGERLATDEAVVQAARKLVANGIELVAVSMGKAGAWFVTGTTVVVARPPDVEVRSTVGAGDAMVAGIVAAQLRNLPLKECARLATTFSLDALTRLEPGLPSAAKIKSFEVVVKEASFR
jgi:1-phosphofructokinase